MKDGYWDTNQARTSVFLPSIFFLFLKKLHDIDRVRFTCTFWIFPFFRNSTPVKRTEPAILCNRPLCKQKVKPGSILIAAGPDFWRFVNSPAVPIALLPQIWVISSSLYVFFLYYLTSGYAPVLRKSFTLFILTQIGVSFDSHRKLLSYGTKRGMISKILLKIPVRIFFSTSRVGNIRTKQMRDYFFITIKKSGI